MRMYIELRYEDGEQAYDGEVNNLDQLEQVLATIRSLYTDIWTKEE